MMMQKLKRMMRVPLTQIVLFAALMSALMGLSMLGVIPSSFTYAIGNTLIYAIVAVGFCLLLGYSGLASLGTAGLIGVGAYAAFYVMESFGLPYIVALAATLAVSVVIGVAVGFISLRVEGLYLAILTLGLSEILRNLLMAVQATIKLNIANVRLFGMQLSDSGAYFLVLFTFSVLLFLTANLIDSPTGRAMLAMKNSTSAAQAMGISLMKFRLLAFVISTVFAAIGGLMYMMYVRSMTTATSTVLTMTTSLNILGAVIIGGAKSLWGTTLGAFIVYGIQSMFLSKIPFFQKNPAFITMLTGLLIVVVVMFYPGGLTQLFSEVKAKLQKRRTFSAKSANADGDAAEVKCDNALDARQEHTEPERRIRHESDEVLLRVRNLKMYFGGLKAVDDLSFDVKKGEIFGLIGPNGAGKTTVFNCITRFYNATDGEMHFSGRQGRMVDLRKYRAHDVILHGIVRTFQNVEVIREVTVLENLLIAGHRQYGSSLFAQALHLPVLKKEERLIRERAMKVLEFMGLTGYKDWYAFGLPYGVLKRIEIARTLMCDPRLIILDEPAAGLNDTETAELAKLIRRIRDEYDCTILLVEHDMGLVMDICDTVCAISFGKLLAIGTTEQVQADPNVQTAYLGVEEEG